jgi:hypothetical protein
VILMGHPSFALLAWASIGEFLSLLHLGACLWHLKCRFILHNYKELFHRVFLSLVSTSMLTTFLVILDVDWKLGCLLCGLTFTCLVPVFLMGYIDHATALVELSLTRHRSPTHIVSLALLIAMQLRRITILPCLVHMDWVSGQAISVVEHFNGRLVIRSYEIRWINNGWRLHKSSPVPIAPNITILVQLNLYQKLLCSLLYLLLMTQRCLL